jgi:O-antigen/teichoic acid export membrane protein
VSTTAGRRLLRQGAGVGLALLVANAANYASNLVLGRWLAPAAFADATLIVTLVLVLAAAASALQLATAGAVSREQDLAAVAAIRRSALRMAGLAGAVLGAACVVCSPMLRTIFHASSAMPFVLAGILVPVLVVLGAERGVLQGRGRLGALNLVALVEAAVRLVGTVVALSIRPTATVAVGALLASVVVAAAVAFRLDRDLPAAAPSVHRSLGLGVALRPALVVLVAQTVLSASDIVVAKMAFSGNAAARYAVIALVGRAVLVVGTAAATVLVPEAGRNGLSPGLLPRMVGVVLAPGIVATVGAFLFGDRLLQTLAGSSYGGLGHQLAAYAGISALVAAAVAVASATIPSGHTGPATWLLGGAAAQVVLLGLNHGDARALLWVQVIVAVPLLVLIVRSAQETVRIADMSKDEQRAGTVGPVAVHS